MEWKGFSPGIAPTRRPSSRLWRHHSSVCNAVGSSPPGRLRPQPVRFARMSDSLCIGAANGGSRHLMSLGATVTFGDVPIYLHEADREWVMRPDERIHFWSGDTTKLHESVTLIHCGGHFAGSTARFPVLSFEQTPRRVSDVRSTGIGVRSLT